MSVTAEDVDLIVNAVLHALDQRRNMSNESHDEDHRLIRQIAAERKERAILYRAMRETVAKWGLLGVLAALCTIVWFFITHAIVTGRIPS